MVGNRGIVASHGPLHPAALAAIRQSSISQSSISQSSISQSSISQSPIPPKTTPWIVPLSPKPTGKIRLFCFHPAGTGASLFRSWPQYLPPEIELFGIQLPGREGRIKEPRLTEFSQLFPSLLEAISPWLNDKPFAFFGHSLGALIGFALGQHLIPSQTKNFQSLFVSSRQPPDLPLERPVCQQPDQVLIELLRQYGGTPEVVLQSPEMMNLFLPILRADLTLNEAYADGPNPKLSCKLSCPIFALGGQDDLSISPEQLAQWHRHTTGEFKLLMLPGGHMYFKEKPKILLKQILEQLGYVSKVGQRNL
jgi:medium-chain acyl-[acyl-carrier-protein] hydrolase